MALSDLQRSLMYSSYNNIWQHEMLMNAYFHGSAVGANLRKMMIGQQPVMPLTNPFDEAITGKLRSDSRSIRQNARNVQEAAQMMGIASEAMKTIKTTLEEMEALARDLKEQKDNHENGNWVASEGDKADYKAMYNKIQSIIEYTKYNGIPLLDSSKWAGTEQIDTDGNVFIKGLPGSDGGFDVTFRGLDEMAWNDLDENQLTEDDIDSLLSNISSTLGDITLIDDIYSRRKSGLEFHAASLESQADILDQAVEARRQTPTLSLEEIILNLLHRYSGTIFNQTG